MIEATRELLTDAAESIRRLKPPPPTVPRGSPLPGPREPLRVLGYATNGAADEVALTMLAHALDDLPIVVEITNTRLLASELVSLVQTQDVSVVCLADLPPSPPSKTRYLVKRLHDALPDVRILVGRWAPAALADESTQALRDAGATLVATTLAETRTYLGGLVEIPRIPPPQAVGISRRSLSEKTRQRARLPPRSEAQSVNVTGHMLFGGRRWRWSSIRSHLRQDTPECQAVQRG